MGIDVSSTKMLSSEAKWWEPAWGDVRLKLARAGFESEGSCAPAEKVQGTELEDELIDAEAEVDDCCCYRKGC